MSKTVDKIETIQKAGLKKLAPIAKILALLLLIVGFTIYGVDKVDDMNGPEPGDPKSLNDYNDFNVDFGAGEKLLAGEDIYFQPTSPEGRYFLYPPIYAIYMSVIYKLGLRWGAIYWFLSNVIMLMISAYLITQVVAKDRSTRIKLAILGIILTGRFIDSDLGNGNVNLHVLFFLSVGLWCLAKYRSFWGGFSFGLAALTKVTPIIFLGYLMWKAFISWIRTKQQSLPKKANRPIMPLKFWNHAIVGMLVSLVLFTAVVPSLILGWKKNHQLHQDFYTSMVGPYVRVSDHPEKYWDSGYSLKTVLIHYLSDITNIGSQKKSISVNFANLSPQTVWILYLVLSLIMVGLSLIAWQRHLVDKVSIGWGPLLLALELGTLAALMVTISPLTRKAHYVVLLIPVIASLSTGLKPDIQFPRRIRKLLITGAVAVGVIGIGSSIDVVGRHLFEILIHGHRVLFWASLIIWTSCTIALIKLTKAPARNRTDSYYSQH